MYSKVSIHVRARYEDFHSGMHFASTESVDGYSIFMAVFFFGYDEIITYRYVRRVVPV